MPCFAVYTACEVGGQFIGLGDDVVVNKVKWRCTKDGFQALGKENFFGIFHVYFDAIKNLDFFSLKFFEQKSKSKLILKG